MLSVDEALREVLAHSHRLPAESSPLNQCLGRVVAGDLVTPHDSPPFDKSMMDGFAVNSRTVFDGHEGSLAVIETITAGTLPTRRPGPGTACRIMTGAPLPDGADCVIPIEKTVFNESHPDGVVIDREHIAAERHVLRQGASAKTGSSLLASGTELQPQHIAVLAEFGLADVNIIPLPRVAILATGDELVPSSEPLTPGRIRNSNEPMLAAQVTRATATPVPLGIARDNVDELSDRIFAGVQQNVLLLSGGVSAGTLDLVPAQLEAAGVRHVFHKIHMKPGKPLWFGILENDDHRCLVFGLPGNPVSSMVCFELFVRPALNALAGRSSVGPHHQTGTLTQDIVVKGDRPTYFPSQLTATGTGIEVTPVAWGGSADLRSTSQADGLCLLHPDPGEYTTGDFVQVIAWGSG